MKLYEEHELVQLAPKEPVKHNCPDCKENGTKCRLRYLRSFYEQWGSVVTRHDVYRCRKGCGKFVSTNGREPELAADWV